MSVNKVILMESNLYVCIRTHQININCTFVLEILIINVIVDVNVIEFVDPPLNQLRVNAFV